MSYTNQTVHYGIPLPQQTDLVNGLDWNTSSEKVDGALYDATQIANTLKSDMEEVKEDIVDLKAEDVKIETSATELTARVATNEQNIAEQIKDIQNLYDLTSANNEQSATSSRDYAVGEYFIYNDVLYKCTVAITKGDTIVPNVNCSATNTTTEIKAEYDSLDKRIGDEDISYFGTDITHAIETIGLKEIFSFDYEATDTFGSIAGKFYDAFNGLPFYKRMNSHIVLTSRGENYTLENFGGHYTATAIDEYSGVVIESLTLNRSVSEICNISTSGAVTVTNRTNIAIGTKGTATLYA